MNIEEILAEYDSMFGTKSLNEIESYLLQKIELAKTQSRIDVLVTLLNETIGFYRDTTQKEKSLAHCVELKNIMIALQMEGTIEYATSMLNIANAYRAFGKFQEGLAAFTRVETIYNKQLSQNDFRFASLYNNWSLLYQEMQDFEHAKEMLLKALSIVDSYEDALIPQATTRSNLAATLLQLGTGKAYEEAIQYLQEALLIHEKDGGGDFHYGAALVAMGDAYCYKKDFTKASEYYAAGLREIEKHVGKTDNYTRVLEKYHYAKQKSGSNLARSKKFYEEYGKEMILSQFPGYQGRIAAGMVGEGSDCFGFDDHISKDHDYEIGFCLWLTQEDYDQIGGQLQAAYDTLTADFIQPGSNNPFIARRRGVFSINDFYNQLLGTTQNFEGSFVLDYETLTESALATATNGFVFQDDLGIFSTVRKKLQKHYPKDVFRKRLAACLHDFSQYAQSNYARMMARKDYLTAGLCIGKGIEASMDLMYLLARKYAPYYKWKRKGLEGNPLADLVLPLLQRIGDLPCQKSAWEDVHYSASAINRQDQVVQLFEDVAGLLLTELKRQKLVHGEDVFLERYVNQILEDESLTLVEKIIRLEWNQFDKVKNEGGRADCQDDFGTFSIMRKSQYLTWPKELLASFYQDLLTAESKGWNLITEKYARMMQSTCPERYARLAPDLPPISKERMVIQEEIIGIQIQWMEEFAKAYPKMAGNARSIRTREDSEYNTSYETYLRGELGTYSEETLVLYGRFIVGLLQEGRNLAYLIMENTARLYGYESVSDAEESL